jgi:hypothetical protein
MKKNTYTLNTVLAFVLGAVMLAFVLVRTFAPRVILFELDIPNLMLISLAALLVDHYMAPNADRCYICIPLFSAITFGLLPFAACVVGGEEALKLGVAGGVIFTVTTWLFSSVQDRLSTGPAAKAAPMMSAFGIYLAVQGLMGMIL